jgi:hypothetical protein
MVQRFIPTGRNVRFDAFGFDDPRVFQHDRQLLGEKRPVEVAAFEPSVRAAG